MLFGRDSCSCDLMWEDSILIGEYDSKKAHLSPEQMEWDKKKSTALSISGYKVINITPSNLSTFEKTEELFLMLRKELGFRTRKEKWQEYRDMRRETYNLLFNRREKPKEQLTETSRMSL